jgi:hypothetical protein
VVAPYREKGETQSFHIRLRAFAVFGNEAVDMRGDNGQRYRAELILSWTPLCARELMISTSHSANSYSIRST